jgi:hypothetical protein
MYSLARLRRGLTRKAIVALVLVALMFVSVSAADQGGASAARRLPWHKVGIWLRNELPKDVVANLIAGGTLEALQQWWVGGGKPDGKSGPSLTPPEVKPIERPPIVQVPRNKRDSGPWQPLLPPGTSWNALLPSPRSGANSLVNRPPSDFSPSTPPAPAPRPFELQACSGSSISREEAFERGYQFDTGGPSGRRDTVRARDCYLVSARRGSLYSQYLLAHSYLYDEPKNLQNGLSWLEQVADTGFLYAQAELGDFYHPTDGIEPNRDRAMHWYRQAADQRLGYAEYELALLYAAGRNPGDRILAFEWLREALLDRYEPALDEMNRMLNGYHRRALQVNDPELLYLFGKAHELGVPEFIWPDAWEAGAYYCDAAREGYRRAQTAFAELRDRHPRLPRCN